MSMTDQSRPLAEFMRQNPSSESKSIWSDANHSYRPNARTTNVGGTERKVSLVTGSILALLGIAKRDLPGAVIAAVGAGLVYRGATGHCHTYEALGIDTAEETEDQTHHGFHVLQSCNINRPAAELYSRWRNFEDLPNIMTHLQAVEVLTDHRSRWTASAPGIVGGTVVWEAEITEDIPNERIAWRSLPGARVENHGSVLFSRLPGDRGTAVRVELEYQPPAGVVGKWVAKLFGEAPDQQIREDLRRFKRIIETGEAPTIEGQPHGQCAGFGWLNAR
jgi:uncharacterized membrane protein